MQIPKRRGEEEARLKRVYDYYLTPEKIEAMKRQLERLKKEERPLAISETQRLAEMGDFSENVGYQVAKAHLRRINGKIMTIEERLKMAIPIERGGSSDGRIRIGSAVTLWSEGREVRYEIVGALETDPLRGRISHLSPLGQLLLGHIVGDEVVFTAPKGSVMYQVLSID